MKTKLYRNIILTFAAGLVAASCNSDQLPQPPPNVSILEGAKVPSQITVTPHAIPGSAKSEQGAPTGGYGPSNVQAQLKIDVKDGVISFDLKDHKVHVFSKEDERVIR